MWSTDMMADKSVPVDANEWCNFIQAKGLNIATPDSVWSLQEMTPPAVLNDSISVVQLSPSNAPLYHQTVTNWNRFGVATSDGLASAFDNHTSSALPLVTNQSMMVLLMYGTTALPPAGLTRTILVGGSGLGNPYAKVDVDSSNHLVLCVGSTCSTGGTAYPTTAGAIIPVVLKLDRTHAQQHIITHREVITQSFIPLGQSQGIFIGGASDMAPAGVWVYMAAWYKSHAEIGDTDIQALITALGGTTGWP
jgi:hypothetical protein